MHQEEAVENCGFRFPKVIPGTLRGFMLVPRVQTGDPNDASEWIAVTPVPSPQKPPKPRQYVGSYHRPDGHYSLIFQAANQADAEAHCAALGMAYDGVIG